MTAGASAETGARFVACNLTPVIEGRVTSPIYAATRFRALPLHCTAWRLLSKSKALLPAQGTSRSREVRVGNSLKRIRRSRHR
jgi:hypothetical protein